MLNLLKKYFFPKKYKVIRKEVNLEHFIKKMQLPKDITIRQFSTGEQEALCNKCEVAVLIIKDENLIWHICKGCGRKSFGAVGNLKRDIALASEFGGVFEYQIYYFKEIPKELKIPSYQ